jgi:glutamyl-tRNA reductase
MEGFIRSFICVKFVSRIMPDMQNKFRAISLSYKNAPVQIREVISLDEGSIHALLVKMKDFFSMTDVLILSTCNRTEVYYSHELDLSTEIIKLIGLEKGLTSVVDYIEYFEIFNQDIEAIQHLFRVSIGLEAQVVGDLQIANQVKRAYQASADLDLAGPFLHRLMHTIFLYQQACGAGDGFQGRCGFGFLCGS